MLNASLPLDNSPNDEIDDFYRKLEEAYTIRIRRREIVDDVRWRYLIEFNSEADATMFLLRFS
jgi:hypothetical protein